MEPFEKLPKRARQGVEEESARLVDFLGGKLDLHWAEPDPMGRPIAEV